MNKKLSSVLFAILLLLGLMSGCSAANSGDKEYDLDTLANDISETGAFSDILSEVTPDIAKNVYGYENDDVSESRLLCSTGATTEEIGLFKCKDDDAATRVETLAKERIQTQKNIYESYAPAEITKLNDAIVAKKGQYVFYVVSTDSSKVEKIIG